VSAVARVAGDPLLEGPRKGPCPCGVSVRGMRHCGPMKGPLLTREVHDALRDAARAGLSSAGCSLDLGKSVATVGLEASGWTWQGRRFPWLGRCRDRTIYYWTGAGFEPAARFSNSHLKLVPTPWGPPVFEIDGVKMLVSARVSPWEDARRKVELVQPRGKTILDTCGGLGYYAAWCVAGGASQVLSFEKNPDVLWLRSLNPWSPPAGGVLSLVLGDIGGEIESLPEASVDAVLHDPPRFGMAGELYSRTFYEQLARVLRRKGRLFHYTGTPNALTTGRDVPREVARRLREAGFAVERAGDGVLATRR
jgi:predicted methyltransferase